MRKLHTTLRQITAFLIALSLLMISAAAEELLIMPAPTDAAPWGLTLTLTNVTSTGATLTVTHSGEASKADFFETGVAYGLEVRKDGQWVPLPLLQDWVVIAIAYGIPTGGSRDFEMNWEAPYGELPPEPTAWLKTSPIGAENRKKQWVIETITQNLPLLLRKPLPGAILSPM